MNVSVEILIEEVNASGGCHIFDFKKWVILEVLNIESMGKL